MAVEIIECDYCGHSNRWHEGKTGKCHQKVSGMGVDNADVWEDNCDCGLFQEPVELPSRKITTAKEDAQRVLRHYFELAGVPFHRDKDYAIEVNQIVEDIIEATTEEVLARIRSAF